MLMSTWPLLAIGHCICDEIARFWTFQRGKGTVGILYTFPEKDKVNTNLSVYIKRKLSNVIRKL